MNETEFAQGVAAAQEVYPQARLLPPQGTIRPLRVAPVPIPAVFWGGGATRLLVVFDLATHNGARPRCLLGIRHWPAVAVRYGMDYTSARTAGDVFLRNLRRAAG